MAGAEREASDLGAMAAEEKVSIAELWARAAHDLRQPVQAALLLSKVLAAAEAPPDIRRAARHIGTSLSSLYNMLEFLVVLSRLEAGVASVPIRNCELAEVLAAPLREIKKVAAKRGVALRTRNLRGRAKSNPQLLAMAAKSLLLNALKFGSGAEIVVSCRRRSDMLVLEVRFCGGVVDPTSEESAFFEVSTLAAGARSSELGIGRLLLERLCWRLGHTLEQTRSPPDGRLLAIWVPRGTP
jgi:two-component system, sensor histidine kinase